MQKGMYLLETWFIVDQVEKVDFPAFPCLSDTISFCLPTAKQYKCAFNFIICIYIYSFKFLFSKNKTKQNKKTNTLWPTTNSRAVIIHKKHRPRSTFHAEGLSSVESSPISFALSSLASVVALPLSIHCAVAFVTHTYRAL